MSHLVNDRLLSSPLLLSVAIVVVFLIFQVSFLWVAITGDGSAMYLFWQPAPDHLATPFFVVVAALLLVWMLFIAFLIVSSVQGRFSLPRLFYSLVVLAVLGVWTVVLVYFWRAMAFERGEVSAEEWFDAAELKLYQSQHLYFRAKRDYAFLPGALAVRVPDGWQDFNEIITSTEGVGVYFKLPPRGPYDGTPAYPELSVVLLDPREATVSPDEYLAHVLSENVQVLQLPIPLQISGELALQFAYVFGTEEIPESARMVRIETVVQYEGWTYVCREELALSQYEQSRWMHPQFCSTLELNSSRPRPLSASS